MYTYNAYYIVVASNTNFVVEFMSCYSHQAQRDHSSDGSSNDGIEKIKNQDVSVTYTLKL